MTDELVIHAIKSTNPSLKDIPKDYLTEKVIEAVCLNDPKYILYLEDVQITDKLLLNVFLKDPDNLRFIPKDRLTREIIEAGSKAFPVYRLSELPAAGLVKTVCELYLPGFIDNVKDMSWADLKAGLLDIPKPFLTDVLISSLIKRLPSAFQLVDQRRITKEHAQFIIKENPSLFPHIPERLRNYELNLLLAKQKNADLRHVADYYLTEELLIHFAENNLYSLANMAERNVLTTRLYGTARAFDRSEDFPSYEEMLAIHSPDWLATLDLSN